VRDAEAGHVTATTARSVSWLHALIKEARRRQRRRKLKLLASGLLVISLGVSAWLVLDSNTGGTGQKARGAPASPHAATSLTILAINPVLGRATFRFSCDPVGGNLPKPWKACSALRNEPALITHPKPWVCAGNEQSWWDVSITGNLAHHAVRRSFSTCWTPQMPTIGQLRIGWNVLQRHIGPQRQQAVLGGTTHTFAPGLLRPGDLVTCNLGGHHWENGIPNAVIPLNEHYSTGPLSVHLQRDGSVVASCRIQRS